MYRFYIHKYHNLGTGYKYFSYIYIYSAPYYQCDKL